MRCQKLNKFMLYKYVPLKILILCNCSEYDGICNHTHCNIIYFSVYLFFNSCHNSGSNYKVSVVKVEHIGNCNHTIILLHWIMSHFTIINDLSIYISSVYTYFLPISAGFNYIFHVFILLTKLFILTVNKKK